jgi:hypothetical protein
MNLHLIWPRVCTVSVYCECVCVETLIPSMSSLITLNVGAEWRRGGDAGDSHPASTSVERERTHGNVAQNEILNNSIMLYSLPAHTQSRRQSCFIGLWNEKHTKSV